MENKLDDEIEMCSNCFEDEEYDFGLCVTCVEEAFAEIAEITRVEKLHSEYEKTYGHKPLTLIQVSGNLLHSATQQTKE